MEDCWVGVLGKSLKIQLSFREVFLIKGGRSVRIINRC